MLFNSYEYIFLFLPFTFFIYFSITTLKYSIKMLLNQFGTAYIKNGMRVPFLDNYLIKHNKFKFDKYDAKGHFYLSKQYKNYVYSRKQFEYVKKIIKLCEENNIKLILYNPPVYYEHFITIYKNLKSDYITFKQDLANIINYIDFNGINEITLNKSLFYDPSHLRNSSTNIIFDRLFKAKQTYGYEINKGNINSFLDKTENTLKELHYKLNKENRK